MKILKITAALALLVTACTPKQEVHEAAAPSSIAKAVAVVHPVGESGVSGTVYFETVSEGVSVNAEFSGLEEGKKGFHIHQYGDCTAEDGTSAGGHFNPFSKEHSGPEAMNRHVGDMGNLKANSEGLANLNYIDKTITIDQILGRGIIVHAGEDDLTSQPSGAAGPRIACGVIGIQK